MFISRALKPLTAATLAALFVASCASTGSQRQDTAALHTAIKSQADAWDTAIVRKDRAAIADNMHEDFMQIDSNGGHANKQEFLANLTDSKLVIEPYTVEEFRARVHGDTIITTGSTRMTGSYDGKPFQSHYRFTDVYIRDGARWKVVQVQTTRIKEP